MCCVCACECVCCTLVVCLVIKGRLYLSYHSVEMIATMPGMVCMPLTPVLEKLRQDSSEF